VVLALFADDDPCAQSILDLQIQTIGAVYDLSATFTAFKSWTAWDHSLRFKYSATNRNSG